MKDVQSCKTTWRKWNDYLCCCGHANSAGCNNFKVSVCSFSVDKRSRWVKILLKKKKQVLWRIGGNNYPIDTWSVLVIVEEIFFNWKTNTLRPQETQLEERWENGLKTKLQTNLSTGMYEWWRFKWKNMNKIHLNRKKRSNKRLRGKHHDDFIKDFMSELFYRIDPGSQRTVVILVDQLNQWQLGCRSGNEDITSRYSQHQLLSKATFV